MRTWRALLLALILLTAAASAAAEGFRPLPIDLSGGAPLKAKFNQHVMEYEDPTIRVEYRRVESPRTEWNVYYYYALITVKDPSQIRTAPADGRSFVSGVRIPGPTIAKRVNAVLAVNGDYCAAFTGNKRENYILRQGTVFQDTSEDGLDLLLIDEDGDFHVLPRSSENRTADKTVIGGKRVINAFQFGPALVIDGQKVPDEELLDPTHSPDAASPESRWPQRMCIAQIGPLQYMAICCRNGLDLCTLRDLAMSLADCRVVYNLDGGDSTQMMFLGQKINNVKKDQNLRAITDIIYFASAWYPD